MNLGRGPRTITMWLPGRAGTIRMWLGLTVLLGALMSAAMSCPANCNCNAGSSVCQSCKDGYYSGWRGGNYYECQLTCYHKCRKCSDQYDCSECKDGFYTGDNTYCDYSCPRSCQTCTAANACQTCKAGYTGTACQYCIPGKYGTNCDKDCPGSCQTCTSAYDCLACKAGYTGNACQYCSSGTKYGPQCNNNCPSVCKYGTCTRSNGYCKQCNDGRYGNICNKDCPDTCQTCKASNNCQTCKAGYSGTACQSCSTPGKYGPQCNQDCPSGCKLGTCGKSSGHCHDCKDGLYGNICDQNCPSGCKNSICDRSSGHCQQCNNGRHGDTCTLSCSLNCKTCNQNTGACESCAPSYYGSDCNQPCPEKCTVCSSAQNCVTCKTGHYGDICTNECPVNCKNGSCHIIYGSCTEGCIDGYHGTKCEQECPIHCVTCQHSTNCYTCELGFYGYACQYPCGPCKPGTPCRKSNGYCDDGCTDGYYGGYCSNKCRNVCKSCKSHYYACTSCVDGKYGTHSSINYYKCDNDCPANCLNTSCDPDTGNCLACVDGYTGDKCDCPEHCHTCSSPGVCSICKAGYIEIDKHCTCRTDVCTTDTCEACTNSTWYVDNNSGSCCKCSRKCKNRECSAENRCLRGCVAGYYGEGCDKLCSSQDPKCVECKSVGDEYGTCTKCVKGFYPGDDRSICIACHSTCANNSCSPTNGHCTQGCLDTFWGETCDKTCAKDCLKCDRRSGDCLKCPDGKYWKDCSKDCSSTCNVTNSKLICNVKDGQCTHGCHNKTLQGPHCTDKCNDGCVQDECNWQSGQCLRGCRENVYGDTCGTACSDKCMEVESGRRCLGNNGRCVSDCVAGFYGGRCDEQCSDYCANVTCSREEGVCDAGCIPGYVGKTCIQAKRTEEPGDNGAVIGGVVGAVVAVIVIALVLVLVVIILRRRKQRDQKGDGMSKTPHGVGADGKNEAGVDSTAHAPVSGGPGTGPDGGVIYSNVGESVQLYAVPEKRKATGSVANPVYSAPVKDQYIQGQQPASGTDNQTKPAVKQPPKPSRASNKSIEPLKGTVVHASNVKVTGTTSVDGNKAVGVDGSRVKVNTAVNEEEELDEDMGPPVDDGAADKDVYYNTFSARIPVEKLQHYVANSSSQSFEREFQQLPYGLKQPYADAQKAENVSKNRYKGIYPYDESRVRLTGPGSDYINACYIDGFEREKAYIASLGPTEKTMPGSVDFWRMVWQNSVEKIVMLTNLFENGTMKCDQYWPGHGTSTTYGDVTVTCHSEDTYAEYTVRTFTAAKGSDKRSLHHIHFTAWPDKGVPDDVTGLIEFRQKVESCETKMNGPLVVHCSAGVGRTGTYIALDILTRQGHKDRAVNIYGCVLNMREQRVYMVQTKEQYHYLHQAVVHALTFDCEAIQDEQFQQRLTAMKAGHLVKQFEQLQRTCVHLSEEETVAVQTNKSRDQFNRKGADIPGNLYRPRLAIQGMPGSSDYINAVYINSFTRSSHYITAQTPLPKTVTDFLTLIYQYNCVCIVSMDPDQLKDKSVGVYLPGQKQTVKHGPFTVTSAVNETGSDYYTVRKLTLSRQGHSSPVENTLTHFQLTQWPDTDPTPRDAGKFVEFIKKVESSAMETDPDGKILVHCLTGAERSGLFCVVSVLIQKMEIEHQVSVVNTVRQVKSRRMLTIPNKEQFIFCHDCVDAYLRTFDIYSNFSAV